VRRKNFLLQWGLFTCIVTHGQLSGKNDAGGFTSFSAYSINDVDVFSFQKNQASLAQIKNSMTGVMAERKFLLSPFNNYNAAIAVKTVSGNFGLKLGYYGFKDYNESQVALAYARKLGDKADAGIQFTYHVIAIAGYGTAAAIGFEIGTVFHISDELHTGIHASNPVGGRFGNEQQEKLPAIYTAGFGYELSPVFFLGMEIIKEENQPVIMHVGFQYRPVRQLLVRAGVSSTTASAWLGFGFLVKTYSISIAANYHPQLGITPTLQLLFNFKKKEE
jgi:hypothetical protein